MSKLRGFIQQKLKQTHQLNGMVGSNQQSLGYAFSIGVFLCESFQSAQTGRIVSKKSFVDEKLINPTKVMFRQFYTQMHTRLSAFFIRWASGGTDQKSPKEHTT